MPYDFSTMVYGITGNGGTVVLGDEQVDSGLAAESRVLLAPKDLPRM